MNIQTEYLENQLVRLTVTVDKARLEDAKQKAARKVANRVRIPGFRKGKVPYHILVQNGLEGEIFNLAVEDLSQDIYREVIQSNTDLDPYGPGTFEDFKLLDENAVFIYTVPLQPVVKLSDYRAIRREYIPPEVTDEIIERTLKVMQQNEAQAEESTEPVAWGDRVTLDLHSTFADDPKPIETQADDAEDEVDKSPAKGMQFIHEHDLQIVVSEDNKAILPGFNEKLIGANVGDELDFELTVPEDAPDYKDIEGRLIHFNVVISKIEKLKLPELDDAFAQKVTKDHPDGQLQTIEELRAKLRDDIKHDLEEQTKTVFLKNLIEELVAQAEIAFPEAMLQDQINDKIEMLKNRLRQQGISWDRYMNVMQVSLEDLREQYREPAMEEIKHIVVLRQLIKQEKISVSDEAVQARIDDMMAPFDDKQRKRLRKILKPESLRMAVLSELLQERLHDRLFDIVTGAAVHDESNVSDDVEVSETTDNA